MIIPLLKSSSRLLKRNFKTNTEKFIKSITKLSDLVINNIYIYKYNKYMVLIHYKKTELN